MSNGTDRFFEEMLESAKRIAKKDVASDMAALRKSIAPLKKQLATAIAGTAEVVKRETAVARREQAINKQCTKREQDIKYRETDVKLAEQELCHLFKQLEETMKEQVETTTITTRKFVKRSGRRGYYGRMYPTAKSAALSAVNRRVARLIKQEADANE